LAPNQIGLEDISILERKSRDAIDSMVVVELGKSVVHYRMKVKVKGKGEGLGRSPPDEPEP
jgi:hypothetical protein